MVTGEWEGVDGEREREEGESIESERWSEGMSEDLEGVGDISGREDGEGMEVEEIYMGEDGWLGVVLGLPGSEELSDESRTLDGSEAICEYGDESH